MKADNAVMRALLIPKKPNKAADLALRIVYPLLMSLSAGGFLLASLDAPLPVCLTLAAAVFGILFRFGTYKMLFFAPPAAVLIPAAGAGYLIFNFPINLMREYYYIGRISSAVLLFGGTLAYYGAILSKIDLKHTDASLFLPSFLSTAPLLFTVMIYLPTDLFLKNRADFPFALQDMLPIPLVYFTVLTLCISLNVCLFGKKFNAVYSAVMLGLTLCVFVQYMFLNSSLPVMLGKNAEWDTFTSQKIISAAVWCLLFAGSVFVRIKFAGVSEIRLGSVLVPALIGAFELVMLVILLIQSGSSAFGYQLTRLSSKDQFTVSKNQNLVIFVLDEADARVFDEVMESTPEKFDVLKDFTYYSNYSTRYDSTNFAIPQMLTGTDIIPEHNIGEWYERIFASEQFKKFYERLQNNNFKTDIYGDFMFSNQYEYISGIADNMQTVTADDITVTPTSVHKLMTKFSRYLYMPWLAKEQFEPDTSTISSSVRVSHSTVFQNSEFMNACVLNASEGDENRFIFQHLNGIHYPIETDTQKTEAARCLEMMDKYLSEMKRLGVYDDAMIIITGDHGLHLDYGAIPIFYIKEPGHTGTAMTVNTAPIYITDLFSTCLKNAGLFDESTDRELFGTSIYDHTEGEQRERLWFGRDTFKVQGKEDRKNPNMRNNRMFGFFFTGDRSELERITKNDPPDITLEFDSFY